MKLLITAGPTREMLDPVRFLSNLSTGYMGYTLAKEAAKKKHRVTLISGPTSLEPPRQTRFIPIVGAQELKKACEKEFPKHDALIMTAAVCDFTPAFKSVQKIRRIKTQQILFNQTPDIVAGLGKKKKDRVVIGFCLETENWLKNAHQKIKKKNLDGIVANYYSQSHTPFGNRKLNTVFMHENGTMLSLKNQSKKQIALKLLKWVAEIREDKRKKTD